MASDKPGFSALDASAGLPGALKEKQVLASLNQGIGE